MLELYVMRTHIIRSTQRGKHLANMPCKISRFSLRNPLVSLLYTMSAGHDANRSPLSKAMGATASAIHSCSTATSSRQGLHHSGGERHLVYFDHDAGSDDFVAFVYFLQHRQRFNLVGVSVTPANSWWKAGTRATRKILRAFPDVQQQQSDVHGVKGEVGDDADDDGGGGDSSKDGTCSVRAPDIPVAESTLPAVNPFPNEWRYDACKVNLLPQLNDFDTPEAAVRFEHESELHGGLSGQLLLARALLNATSPVTVLATGPLTNLAWVLDNYPDASAKIDKVLIMGGAIDVPGNVYPQYVHESFEGVPDGSAEWNFFWDPPSAKRVWDSDLKLVLTPLDATDEAPVSKETILRLGKLAQHGSAALVGTIWAMVGASLIDSDKKFYAWDLLTVAQLVHPEMFTNTEVTCDIVADGLSQGRVIRTGATSSGGGGEDRGRNVTVVRPRDAKTLYDAILDELSL